MTKEQFFDLYDKVESFLETIDGLQTALNVYLDGPLTELVDWIPTFANDIFFHVEGDDQDEYYQEFWDMIAGYIDMVPEEFYQKWAAYKYRGLNQEEESL